ncbi:hypothetical protein GDO78_022938 [Eleutherodactylus coqui]|uniref:Uncharacterized protein n=1 Tax=Eleutherodactylus coqui TaxID=57060 RepID=A0A8J6AZJ3_ELECQ|nr:hypothetical protein GDO78_022938 [Eleutherodactylus coqui]
MSTALASGYASWVCFQVKVTSGWCLMSIRPEPKLHENSTIYRRGIQSVTGYRDEKIFFQGSASLISENEKIGIIGSSNSVFDFILYLLVRAAITIVIQRKCDFYG